MIEGCKKKFAQSFLSFSFDPCSGPLQWISIDGFKVPEHLNMLRVLNPELYLLRIVIGEVQNFCISFMGSNKPIKPIITRAPNFLDF